MTVDALFWIALGSLAVTSLAAIGARSLREFSRRELNDLCRRHDGDLRFSEILRHSGQVAVGIESLHVSTAALFVVAATMWVVLRAGQAATVGCVQLAQGTAIAAC